MSSNSPGPTAHPKVPMKEVSMGEESRGALINMALMGRIDKDIQYLIAKD